MKHTHHWTILETNTIDNQIHSEAMCDCGAQRFEFRDTVTGRVETHFHFMTGAHLEMQFTQRRATQLGSGRYDHCLQGWGR